MHFNDLSVLLQREEIRVRDESVLGEKLNIVCYMVASPDLWDVEHSTEARGIVFNEQGDCVCRTMEKFFNINENKHSQLSDLDFTDAIAFDKLDGSMISIVEVNGVLLCKTKKSFYSDVAKQAQSYFDKNKRLQDFSKHMIDNGFTPTFEFESPNSQIVVEQTEDKMTLLLARHVKTGKYADFSTLKSMAEVYDVPVVNGVACHDINKYISLVDSLEGVEGWVFLLKSGQRVKLKTKWYLLRHRLTSYHTRNIFDLIIEEEIDDMMPVFEMKPGAMDVVNEISHRIAHLFKETELKTEALCKEWTDKGLSLREIGQNYSQNPYFSLAMSLYKEREPEFKKFVIKNYRKDFDTKPVFWGFDVDA